MARKRSHDEIEHENPFKSLDSDIEKQNDFKDHALQEEQSWHTVPKKKRNREKRNEEKKANKQANLEAQERSRPASISFSHSVRLNSFVKMRDLQGLVLYLLADEPSPQWAAISGRSKIGRVVAVQVPGFDADLFTGRIALPKDTSNLTKSNASDATHSAHGDFDTDAIKPQSVQSPDVYYPVKLESSELSSALKPLADIFTHWWPIRAAGEDKSQFLWSSSRSMLSSPIPKSKSARKDNKNNAVDASKWDNKRTGVTQLIASHEELANCEYVIHPVTYSSSVEQIASLKRRTESKTGPQHGWVDSKTKVFDISPAGRGNNVDLTDGKHVISIDCEMCKTSDVDFELTRISIVAWNGTVILDELVKPPRPITDYLTAYSGISKEVLEPVSTTLEDVQQKLLEIVTENTVIIGHSLNSDLNALKFTHPYVIDTAIIYPHARGPPLRNSLRYLTKRYLNREIQTRQGTLGHDSIEDARAVLDLVKQKCERGPDWGMSGMSDEPIYRRLGRTVSKLVSQTHTEQKVQQKTAHVAYVDAQNNYGVHADMNIVCDNDGDIVSGIQAAISADRGDIAVRGHDFIWSTLRKLEDVRGWRHSGLKFPVSRNDIGRTIGQVPDTKEPTTHEVEEVVADTVNKLLQVYAMLPPDTAFIVYSGAADRREWLRLQHQHQQFKREYQLKKWDELTVRWTDVEEQALRAAYKRARDGGIALITVKNADS